MQINGTKVVYAGSVAERLGDIKTSAKAIIELVEDCKEYIHDGIDEDIIDMVDTVIREINSLKTDVLEEDEF